MVAALVTDIPRIFPRIARVTLACVDPEYEMSRLLEGAAEPPLEPDAFFIVSRERLQALFARSYKPRLGTLDEPARALLFPDDAGAIASAALAPLLLHGELIGCLSQGSREPAHFQPDSATDLLEHLAAVTAMCLDNALSHERLKIDGLTDPLTGLANRRFFERRLREEIERWGRRSGPLVCMLVDVDHFKGINDRHGHQTGDLALQRVARLLGEGLRGSDVLARYGGEEFVLLLPETTEPQGLAIAERLRERIAGDDLAAPSGERLRVTVSAGLVCLDLSHPLPPGCEPAAWLVEQADAALYRAKLGGRNRVVRAAG